MTISAAEHLSLARRHLAASAAQNWSDSARQALIEVGRAEVALGEDSVLTAASVAPEREALVAAAAEASELVREAALTIDSLALSTDDEDGLEQALLARTGYQDLLDLNTWPAPPLPPFDLNEVDTELAAVLARSPLPVPSGIPTAHTWWRPPVRGTGV